MTLSRELSVPDISGGEGWGLEASDQFEGPHSVCEARALQDGGPPSTSRSSSTRRLDGKDGPEGCIPPGPNSSKPPDTSNLPLGIEVLQIHLPTLRLEICTEGIHKAVETSGRFSKVGGCRLIIYLDDLLIVHQDNVQLQQIIPLVCKLGLGSQLEEICATTYSEAGISGFRDPHPANDSIDSSGKNEEDPTRCLQVTDQIISPFGSTWGA